MYKSIIHSSAERSRRFGVPRSVATSTFTIILLALVALPVHARAQEQQRTGTSELVTGASCFLLTPVYGAFKLTFAGAGAIVGGMTWLFTGGDEQAAQRVWDSSLKGTYIITPQHLSGEKPVEFVGSADGTKATRKTSARAAKKLE